MEPQTFAEHNKLKQRMAYTSLFAAIFIVSIKFLAAYLSGSLAVLSELFHSSIDLIACIATLISIKYSAVPPDEDHNYGHHKIESLSALFQVLILVIMCVYLIYEAINRIINPPPVDINIFTFSAIFICIFVDFSRSRALLRVARKTGSQALEADSLHFSSDIMSSIVVLVSMVFTYFNIPPIYKGHPLADPVSAIIVSFVIIFTTFRLTKKAFDALMDKIPHPIRQNVERIIKGNKDVVSIKSLRLRGNADNLFVDCTIEVPRTKMIYEVHDLTDSLEKKISDEYENADVIIHTEPVETGDESINDKIRMIVNREGYKCHDISSSKIGDRIESEIHVEIENTNDLGTAHEEMDRLEDTIKKNIPVIDSVRIHIDEPSGLYIDSEDITDTSADIKNQIESILRNERTILHFHDIKIYKNDKGVRVSMNCEFDKSTPLDIVHDEVTMLESKIYLSLKEKYKNLNNVIIHSEPIGHE
jgi:cation diffusion facilitator family transporter